MRTLLILLFFASLVFADPQAIKTYQLSPAKYQTAVEFNQRLYAVHFLAVAWDALVLAALIRWRVGLWVRNRLPSRVAAVIFLLTLPWIAHLPVRVYRHSLSLSYGISIEGWWPWFVDLLKASAISSAGLALAILVGYALIGYFPRRWWIAAWLLGVVVIVAGTYAAPVVFDPLFFEFRPLNGTNPGLAQSLQRIASRAGYSIPMKRILVMNASGKTRGVNAYMTGFGPSRQIVIWDTALSVLTGDQVETVFAHELGHYALNHIAKGIAAGAAGLLILFWLAHRLSQARTFAIDDVANLPKIFLVALLLGFVAEPVANGFSRWMEHQADVYELDTMCSLVSKAGLNSAEADQIMAEIDLDDPHPGPFIRLWLYSHPAANERMIFAQEYAARAGCP